jgi:hypothetical protein
LYPIPSKKQDFYASSPPAYSTIQGFQNTFSRLFVRKVVLNAAMRDSKIIDRIVLKNRQPVSSGSFTKTLPTDWA